MKQMKKRLMAIFLLSAMILALLTGCSYHTCDFCGEKKMCDERSILGTSIYICSDCKKELNDWGY